MKKIGIILLLLIASMPMASCSSYEELASKRAALAKKGDGDIYLGVVWAQKLFKSFYFEGVQMAVDEVNSQGGINGRKLRPISFYNEKDDRSRDLEIAKEIARDRRIVAVIGHYDDDGAIRVSVTYERGGVIFISPACTTPLFTQHGFKYIFRNVPSDAVSAADCARLLKSKGYQKVAAIDDRSIYGKVFADLFCEQAAKIGLSVVARRSYDRRTSDFKPLFAGLKKHDFDAIFLGGVIPEAGEVIKQARTMRITAPFIGGNGLDSIELWDLSGGAAEGTITTTVFDPEKPDKIVQDFTRDFQIRYHALPDTWAAQGYDEIMLLAHVFRKSRSTIPIVVSSYLRFLESWEGVIGKYSFTRNGDIRGSVNSFQILHEGEFRHLEVTEKWDTY